MFDIGWSELVIIGMVALVVIGPKELPTVLRTVGQWMGKVRRMASEFQGQFQEAMREAEMEELKKNVDSLNQAATDLTSGFDPIGDVEKDLNKTFDADRLTPGQGLADTAAAAPAAPASPPPEPPPSSEGAAEPEPRPATAGSGAT
ncbi:MAG: Sec-independent protein translocase protein TatB [Xanthobacteraceae bacterium]|nr:Sec-independent protein translocase protein TatB [Xanthobacteraceae bacterium]